MNKCQGFGYREFNNQLHRAIWTMDLVSPLGSPLSLEDYLVVLRPARVSNALHVRVYLLFLETVDLKPEGSAGTFWFARIMPMSSRTTQGDDVDFYGPLSPWILDRSGICATETRITVTGIFTREGSPGPRGNITAIGSSHDGNDFTSAACWLLSPFTKHRFAYSSQRIFFHGSEFAKSSTDGRLRG